MLSQVVANNKVMYKILLMLFVEKDAKLVGKSAIFSKKFSGASRQHTFF
jgi:hypothetical protein